MSHHPSATLSSSSSVISQRELKAFIDAALSYFQKVTLESAEIGEASIHFDPPPILEFTGLVQISGACSGFVYVTLSREMVTKIVESIGEINPGDEALLDFAGEIANTISSNVRLIFGSSFNVSTPAALSAASAGGLVCSCASFVLPMIWRGLNAFIVIALKPN